jgi:hypothetical protein
VARRIDDRKLDRSSEGTSPIVLLLASAAIGCLFVLASKSQRQPRRGSASHRTTVSTSPASSSYPDGLGYGPRSTGDSTSVFGNDPFPDNDATEWDRPTLPATAMKWPQKQGSGETRAKSDGTFPGDGSHLVDQGAKTSLYDRSEGGGSFSTDATLPNSGAPTVGRTSEFRNAEQRSPTDRTRSPNDVVLPSK